LVGFLGKKARKGAKMFNYEELLQIKSEIMKKRGKMETNYYFEMALDNLSVLMGNIERLEKEVKDIGNLTTKVYVKGNENIEINPALKELRMQIAGANDSIIAIYDILKREKELSGVTDSDPLMDILKGKTL
jgi:hypothetical protein